MGTLTLVLGGARSGKSAWAEARAAELGGEAVVYLATAEAGDAEMQARIARHRAERPAAWLTLEAPLDLSAALERVPPQREVLLLDCLTLFVSNHLLAWEGDSFAEALEARIQQQLSDLLAFAADFAGTTIVVSNEVGLGLVPPNPLGRAYRDLLGRANQRLAQAAETVIFMVAGLPWQVK